MCILPVNEHLNIGIIVRKGSQYLNTSPLVQVNFASGQVDFQFTCPDEQFEILEREIELNDGVHVI